MNPRMPNRAGPSRMRILIVVSSANQMYSGIGRAAFEFVRHLKDRADFEFAIDDLEPRNRDLVVEFGRREGIAVHLGGGFRMDDALDSGNRDLPGLLVTNRWDLVECLGFANSLTNAALVDALAPDVPLAYTPHDQPLWSVPMSEAQASRITEVHQRVLRRADVVFCDSPAERESLVRSIPDRDSCRFVPLGCDFEHFRAGPTDRGHQLLFVGDLAEPRKRFDRAIAAFTKVRETFPDLRLVVIGNRSDASLHQLPEAIRPFVDLRGYVSESELVRELASSAGFLLFSDFEAFGIPILEALACGTPVFLSEAATTRGLFQTYRAARFVDADDLDAVATVIVKSLKRGPAAIEEALGDRRRLAARFSWGPLAELKWRGLASAWTRRRCWTASA